MGNKYAGTALIALTSILFLIAGCSKNQPPSKLIGRWQVVTILVSSTEVYSTDVDTFDYVVEFKENRTLIVELENRMCTGKWSDETDDRVLITEFDCTNTCCEKDAGERLIELFPDFRVVDRTAVQLSLVKGIQFVDMEVIL